MAQTPGPHINPVETITSVSLLSEEENRHSFLQQLVDKFNENRSMKSTYVKDAFKNYEEIYKRIIEGPNISICLLSEPGFGKTSTLNMVLTGGMSDNVPLKASNKMASCETLLCTEIKYSEKMKVTKVYCTAEKYEKRILRLMKSQKKSEETSDEDTFDERYDRENQVSDEDNEEEEDGGDESDVYSGDEIMGLPRKLEIDPSKFALSEDDFVELNDKMDKNKLEETKFFKTDKEVQAYFDNEKRLQSKDRNKLLMVDRYILHYPCEMLKTGHGGLVLWDIPGYGEQEDGELKSMLIEEVVSNCNIILMGLSTGRNTLFRNFVSDLWKYQAFEKSKDNPPTIVVTARCPKDATMDATLPEKDATLPEEDATPPEDATYSVLKKFGGKYIKQFKANLSTFLDVDFESSPQKKDKEASSKVEIDFFGKYDFAVTLSNIVQTIAIPHLKDLMNWRTGFFGDLAAIIEKRRQIESTHLVFKGLRYAIQIVTLYKNQFPVRSPKLALEAMKKISDEALCDYIKYIDKLTKLIARTEKKREKLKNKLQSSINNEDKSLSNKIKTRVLDSNNRNRMASFLEERIKTIYTRMEMFKTELHGNIDKKISNSIKQQKKDVNQKETAFTNFKEEIKSKVDEIFESLKVVAPNDMISDPEMKLDSYNASLKSMKGILENSILKTLYQESETTEALDEEKQLYDKVEGVRKQYKKYNTKSYEESIPIPSLSNAYVTPSLKPEGTLKIPLKAYESLKELKKGKILASNEKFEETVGSIRREEKSKIKLQLSIQDKFSITNDLIRVNIDRNTKMVNISYSEDLKKTLRDEFKKILSNDILIGTKGGNKSHTKKRIAPIFITTMPEYYDEATPNFLEKQVHDCCAKNSVKHIIFIVVESCFIDKARSFLNASLSLPTRDEKQSPKKKDSVNYVFVSVESENVVNIGKKKKLCMLIAEHFELDVFHVMEDNILHVEEYIKPVYYRHDNALSRYLIYAEAIMYHELHSGWNYDQKLEVINQFHTFVMDKPMVPKYYLGGTIDVSDPIRKFTSDEKMREKCVQDPQCLQTILETIRPKLTAKGLSVIKLYQDKLNEYFKKKEHVGHVSLWNVQSAQSKFLSNQMDSIQKSTHFISSVRGNISTFYGPNVRGIHPVSDAVLFGDEELSSTTMDASTSKKKKQSKNVIKLDYTSGNSFSDEYFIRQMLLHGIGGFQIYAFRYLAGKRVQPKKSSLLPTPKKKKQKEPNNNTPSPTVVQNKRKEMDSPQAGSTQKKKKKK